MKKFFVQLKEDCEIIRQGLKLVKIYLGKNYFSLNLIVSYSELPGSRMISEPSRRALLT